MKKIIIVLFLVSLTINAQEAEELYHKKYSKLSIVLQPSRIRPFNFYNNDGSNNPSVAFTKAFSYQFGVHYNFAQSGAFNFKTGIIAKEFSPIFDLNIDKSQIGNGTIDYSFTQFNPFNQFVIAVPIKVEYYLRINNKFNATFGLGLVYNAITGGDGDVGTQISIIENNVSEVIFIAEATEQDKNVISAEASFGFQYKANFAIIQVDYLVSGSGFGTPLRGSYQFLNLNNSTDKFGDFQAGLNFNSISIIISPKKGWLKRKSKK